MEGTGTLKILVTSLDLPITIFSVDKIHKNVYTHTHTYTQTHTNVKDPMVIYFIESCWIVLRAKICIRLHLLSTQFKIVCYKQSSYS